METVLGEIVDQKLNAYVIDLGQFLWNFQLAAIPKYHTF